MIHKILLLTLLNLKGVGRKKAILHYQTYQNKISSLNDFSKLFELNIERLELETAYKIAMSIYNKCQHNDIRIITVYSDLYPESLYRLSDFPAILYLKGECDLINTNIAAVIGSRNPINENIERTKEVVRYFGENDYTILSGLALGIDKIAHEESLLNNIRTIAVLPSGILNVMPKSNVRLAEEILENNGLLISEYPPEEAAAKYSYVQRDRLQSGLSSLLYLVQSKLNGGSMHAVKVASKISIQLFVDSSCLHDDSCNGNKELIENSQGTPVKELSDIIINSNLNKNHKLCNEQLTIDML
jgi:DNA processing protein